MPRIKRLLQLQLLTLVMASDEEPASLVVCNKDSLITHFIRVAQAPGPTICPVAFIGFVSLAACQNFVI